MDKNLFENNKYTKWYFSIIEAASSRETITGYSETHHIVPKSLGGSNKKENIVILTAKEHFIAHHLLTKMTKDKKDAQKMWSAFFFMHTQNTKENQRLFFARTYSIAKKNMAEAKKSLKGPLNHFYGKKHSEETRKKLKHNWSLRKPSNHSKKIHVYENTEGFVFTGTQYEFYVKYNLNNKAISRLTRGKIKSSHGWKCIKRDERAGR